MALREWCGMARGREGEAEEMLCRRRWAFKTRRVWGSPARLSLPPSQPTLPCLFALLCCASTPAVAPALEGLSTATNPQWDGRCGLRRSHFSTEEKRHEDMLQRGFCCCSVGHMHCRLVVRGARKWEARLSEAPASSAIPRGAVRVTVNEYLIRIG
jgi:hypothetical protein